MISDRGLSHLRMAATVAMLVPTAAVRVSSPAELLFEVSWMGGGTALHFRPCAFRNTVGRALAWREEGRQVHMCGLQPGSDPLVEIVLSEGDRSLPPDIYQVKVEAGWRHLFACLLPPARCHEALGPMARGFGFLADEVTGVTVVQALTDVEDPDEVAEFLLEVRARLLVVELVEDMCAASPA